MRSSFARLVSVALFAAFAACDDSNQDGTLSAACSTPPALEKDAYCETCAFSATASPAQCTAPRIVNACCTWVTQPAGELLRGTGMRRHSSTDPTLQLTCLDAPDAPGTSQAVAVQGVVRLFSSGSDSTDVRVEIFREGDGGALDALVGAGVTTTSDDATATREDLLARCPDGGCTFRGYSYANVPTETRLVVRTTSATTAARWGTVYEYGVYIPNASVSAAGVATFDATAIALADLGTIAAASGGFATRQEKGLLLAEVQDCAGVRLANATGDIDAAHDGDVLYFDNEANPLPDSSRSAAGTTRLGTFGALNVGTGAPIRVAAVGKSGGQNVLLGTHTVQVFQGSLTTVTLRGRRPWQR